VALVSLVSPYAADREAARGVHTEQQIDFLEVFVDTPLEECERRDPKGLYARARAGEIPDFTGISAPYEAPETPELTLGAEDVEAAVDRLWALLVERGVVPR
jgi:bifunctional enzyme CysN/CysC